MTKLWVRFYKTVLHRQHVAKTVLKGGFMDIGAKLKRLRLACGMTQEELADRCELTKGYISQLENELTSPSISTLTDILQALGSDLAAFFGNDKDEQIVFSEDDFFVKEVADHTITWLVPNAQKNEMEPILLELAPGASLSKDMPHEGEEFGYVLSGAVVLHLGKNAYMVKAGQSFYYVSEREHRLENKGTEAATLLWVSSPPTF
jgi:transcriptional regulator with XRE-family HTH domain